MLRIGGRYDVGGLVATGGTVTVDVFGFATESARVRLGTGAADTVKLQIDAGGVYDVAGAGPQVIDSLGTASVVNGGLFEATASGGLDTVATAFTNTAAGTILVARGRGLAGLPDWKMTATAPSMVSPISPAA